MTDQRHPNPLSQDTVARMNAWWRAANYLSVGQIYLLANPLLREPLRIEHVKPRLLGHWGTTPGLNFLYLHLNRIITERDLNLIFIAGPGHGAPGVVASTWLEGTYSETYPERLARRRGHASPVPPVLLPRRHPQPRGAGHARLDPRGRRTRLLAVARLRRGAGQSRPDRRLRRRRRRGGNRAAGDLLAQQQVPQPGDRRRRAADPAPERLQDRQSHGAGAHSRRGTARADDRLRLRPDRGRRRRSRRDAPGDGGGHGPRVRRHPRHPARRPRRRHDDQAALADDHPAQPERLDRPEDRGRAQDRGLLARPSGAVHHGQAGAPDAAGRLDAQLPPGRAVRRGRPPGRGDHQPRPGRRQAHERQSARQWRPADAAAADARLRRLCRRCAQPGRGGRRSRPASWAPSCAT